MRINAIHTLANEWRDDADRYERDDARVPAHRLLRRLAEDLEERLRELELEELTLQQAASETGYSYSALDKMERRGDLPSESRGGTRYVRRSDLPRKPAGKRESEGPDVAAARLGNDR